jgi:ribose transport system substrate-binding protein
MSTNETARRWRRTAFLSLVLAVACAATLAACGSSNDNKSDTGAAAAKSTSTAAAPANASTDTAWCGKKPVTLGIYDGGGLNAWSKESLKQVQIEANKCPAIKKQIVVNAGFDPSKGVSGVRGLVAQGANAIVLIPDSGVCSELPAMRQATARKVVVVPWAANGCGQTGKDYFEYVDFDPVAAGKLWTEWMVKQLNDKGNIVYLGGPAGNPVDAGEIKGMYEVLQAHPNVKVLGKVTEKVWPVTNWDPAAAQKVSAALLAKYPQIDAIISSYGSVAEAGLKAFEKANRKPPAIATLEQNQLACDWKDRQGKDGEFALATISNRNWLGRIAVRKAVAEVNGVAEPGKAIVELPLVEDSTNADLQPVCNPSDPPEAYHSSDSPEKEIETLVYGKGA